jgi:hypothetical protein
MLCNTQQLMPPALRFRQKVTGRIGKTVEIAKNTQRQTAIVANQRSSSAQARNDDSHATRADRRELLSFIAPTYEQPTCASIRQKSSPSLPAFMDFSAISAMSAVLVQEMPNLFLIRS